MTPPKSHQALACAVKAANAAGALMRRNLHSQKKINVASAHDIKLDLDVRCQKLITGILLRAFPEIPLLGEEDEADAASTTDAEYRWVVDPIDGTVNYASGIPHACVSIALQARGDVRRADGKPLVTDHASHVTIVGVVYDPFQNELWTAIRGQPARLNGRVIHVSNRSRLADTIVSIGFSKSPASISSTMPYFEKLIRRVRKIRMMGAAALGLTYVATGRFDAYVERGVNLWDVAAGGLIVECAGGEFWNVTFDGGKKIKMIASNGLLGKKLRTGVFK